MAKKNSKLDEAVAIFKELGWEKATKENIFDLPLGTTEQRKVALEGLKTGDFYEYGYISESTVSRIDYHDVDAKFLGIFAVMTGVNTKRALELLRFIGDSDLTSSVITYRGEKFINEFLSLAVNENGNYAVDHTSSYGKTVVKLVYKHGLKAPESAGYINDWSICMSQAMGIKYARYNVEDLNTFKYDVLKERFEEHVRVGFATNIIPTSAFSPIILEGVKRGLISRDEVVDLVFPALDSAIRPIDRKTFVEILEELEVTDKELIDNVEALIPILSIGDNVIINKLAPRLIKVASDEDVINLLTASFSATTIKAKNLVLKAALERSCPSDVESILPWINVLVGDKDSNLSKKANELLSKWNIEKQEEYFVEEVTEVQGFWRETPELWDVPTFELGEVSQVALTDIISEIINRPNEVDDVVNEKLLAMANALALKNKEECKLCFKGIKNNWGTTLLNYLKSWADGNYDNLKASDVTKNEVYPIMRARNLVTVMNIDKIPCVLSTPSKVDLTITLSDLVERLTMYKEKGVEALEADLLLAITRIDVETKTEKDVEALSKLDVPILLESGKKMKINSSEAILEYLENPIKDVEYNSKIDTRGINKGFPERKRGYYEAFSILPCLGDYVLDCVYWEFEVYHEKGLILRQVARRGKPLPSGCAINILAAQRSSSKHAVEDAMLSVIEAWERGLLIPKVANLDYIDWGLAEGKLTSIGALAKAFDWIIREGILSVVWWILDDIVKESLKAPRLLSGTAEILELIDEFLPEVLLAIEKGLTDESALELKGVRELALLKGSSKAVTLAKKIVNDLSEVKGFEAEIIQKEVIQKVEAEADNILVMEYDFEEVWIKQNKKKTPIFDGVEIEAQVKDEKVYNSKGLVFKLKLPNKPDKTYHFTHLWEYGIENGRLVRPYEVDNFTELDELNRELVVELFWDVKQKAVQVIPRPKGDKFENVEKTRDYSMFMLTVIIGYIADDEMIYTAPRVIKGLIKQGIITDEVVSIATRTLLENPDVSPAKLVRIIEKDVTFISVFYSMLVECIKKASEIILETGKPPVWLNRVLDVTLRNIAYLVEAEKRDLISLKEMKNSAEEISMRKSKSTAVEKARNLCNLLQ